MPYDLQVVFPQELVPLSGVTELLGVTPRAVDVQGRDFGYVDDVLINGTSSPRFEVLNRNRLVAQVPETELGNTINSVSVLSTRFVSKGESLLKFQLGPSGRKVYGIQRLVQLFTKILCQTPGSDIWAQEVGGGLLALVGGPAGEDGKGIIGGLAIAVSTTARQITAIQSRDPRIPPTERLLSAQVTSAKFDRNDASVVAVVKILSHTGEDGDINLTL